jgi:DinB superfamily
MPVSELNIHDVLRSQYRAALEMLFEAITKCPESLWLATEYPNKFWHVAYHALFFTHLYLQTSEAEFRRWAKHRPNYQFLGSIPWPPYDRPKIEAPYSKAEILEYHGVCGGEIEERVRTLDFDLPSGFSWLRFSKLELHIYSIRHLQHHAGQLTDRLRTANGIGVAWVGTTQ